MSSLVDNQTASSPWVTSPENWLARHNNHCPYVQELLNEYAFLRKQREGYAKTGNEIPAHLRQLVETSIKPIEALLKALDANFEPCTPPPWLCGTIEPQAPSYYSQPKDTFPQLDGKGSRNMKQFIGLVPADAMQKWILAKPIFGAENIRVYSPHKEDFKTTPRIVYRDPIMIGRIMHNGEAKFFRIAQWDLAKDLAAHN